MFGEHACHVIGMRADTGVESQVHLKLEAFQVLRRHPGVQRRHLDARLVRGVVQRQRRHLQPHCLHVLFLQSELTGCTVASPARVYARSDDAQAAALAVLEPANAPSAGACAMKAVCPRVGLAGITEAPVCSGLLPRMPSLLVVASAHLRLAVYPKAAVVAGSSQQFLAGSCNGRERAPPRYHCR